MILPYATLAVSASGLFFIIVTQFYHLIDLFPHTRYTHITYFSELAESISIPGKLVANPYGILTNSRFLFETIQRPLFQKR